MDTSINYTNPAKMYELLESELDLLEAELCDFGKSIAVQDFDQLSCISQLSLVSSRHEFVLICLHCF